MAGTSPPLSLYTGRVMHARLKPKQHRFTYGVTSILIDIDRLDDADRISPLFSVNRPNIVSFQERHHGKRDGSSLRHYVNELHSGANLEYPYKVELLCYPTVLGHTFNPLSVYFCRDADDRVTALIYQVHNTFGESHSYFEPVLPGQASLSGIRQERKKAFHVSPFLEMDLIYRFRISPPDENASIRILETDRDGPVLAATFFGKHRKACTNALALSVLQCLGITWKVTAGIHFEAMRLWLKGLKVHHRPSAPRSGHYPGNTRRTVS